MRRLALFALLLPAAAQAQTVAVMGPEPIVVVQERDCQLLQRHTPSADTAYQPGKDVQGRPVAPADLQTGAMPIQLPEVVTFDVAINPVGWQQRNSANKQKAAAAAAYASTDAQLKAAQAKAPQLTSTKATLTAEQTALATEQTTWDTKNQTGKDAIIAATGGAAETDPVKLKTRQVKLNLYQAQFEGDAAYKDFLARKTANSSNLASVNAQITANDKVIADAPGTKADKQTDIIAADGKLAAQSGRGLDDVTMSVGKVGYNLKTGAMTFNGQPLTDAQEQAIRAGCARRQRH